MQTFELKIGNHDWEKLNLVTLGTKRMYDVYCCKKCGIKGRSYKLGTITVKEADVKKIHKCNDKANKAFTRIMVTDCKAFGKQFANITPGSYHDIVSPPPGQSSERGEWVMGVNEPVLLLTGEFIYVTKD